MALSVVSRALHEAYLGRVVNVEDARGKEHVTSHCWADETNQAPHVDCTEEDSKPSSGDSEGRVRSNDSKIARHCQLHSGTERRAIQRRDDGCRECDDVM